MVILNSTGGIRVEKEQVRYEGGEGKELRYEGGEGEAVR